MPPASGTARHRFAERLPVWVGRLAPLDVVVVVAVLDDLALVVAYMCLHDIDAMPQAVREVARVLKPSGQLCAAIPHPVNTAGAFQGRDAAAPFVITGSYLDPAPSAMVADRGGIRLTFHSEHRPLEAYFRARAG